MKWLLINNPHLYFLQRKIALDKSVNETDCKMPDVETLEDLDKERESQRVRKKK